MAPQTKNDLLEALNESQRHNAKLGEQAVLLNKLDRDQKNKIDKLKGVARFYRAQRDRVDAYLSAVLDMMELQKKGQIDYETRAAPVDELRDVVMRTERAIERERESRARRPRIQEPSVRDGSMDEGRGFAAYRDDEPLDWEEF